MSWRGDSYGHSLASKGVRTKMIRHQARGLSQDEKWGENYKRLQSSKSTYFLYAPAQFGNLSKQMKRFEKKGFAVLKEEDGIVGRAILLEVGHGFPGAGTKYIWIEERDDEMSKKEGSPYYWFRFQRYTKGAWQTFKEQEKTGRDKLGDRWYRIGYEGES